MSKTLYLEKRGIDFYGADIGTSDIDNYRVTTTDYNVRGRDGRVYYLTFCRSCGFRMRYLSKKAPHNALKKPVREKEPYYIICTNAYKTIRGTFTDCSITAECVDKKRPYSIDSILAIVNEISVDTYDRVEFVDY